MLSSTQKFFLKVFSAWEREWRLGEAVDLTFNLTFVKMKTVKENNRNFNTCLSAVPFFSGGRPQKRKQCSLQKRIFFVVQWDFANVRKPPSNTEVKISSNNIHVNLIFTLFTCILHVLRMHYFTNNFPQIKFISRTSVTDILTIPSVVPINRKSQIKLFNCYKVAKKQNSLFYTKNWNMYFVCKNTIASKSNCSTITRF